MYAVILASTGAAMLCYMIPEVMATILRSPQPWGLNLICSAGGALLTAGLMLK